MRGIPDFYAMVQLRRVIAVAIILWVVLGKVALLPGRIAVSGGFLMKEVAANYVLTVGEFFVESLIKF